MEEREREIYIYIYREKEIQRERERGPLQPKIGGREEEIRRER